jgi:hypothetical protein
LQHLRADYTEVWISGPVVPLVQFADAVHALSSTGIDLLGIGDIEAPPQLKDRMQQFDSIISWYGSNRPEFRAAIKRLGVPCEFHAALPLSDSREHATDFFAKQVGAPPGLIPRIDVPRSTKDEDEAFVAIHPFSGSPRKNWPLDRFLALAGRLPLPVRWICGPEESLPGAVRMDNLAEVAAWLGTATGFIGNDSGITHLAAAVGVPTLALFGPTDPSIWAPRGPNVTVLQAEPISALTIERVLNAFNQLLDLSSRPASSVRPDCAQP